MSNIFITSDLHFNHDKDFIWKKRGFSNVNEMNEAIVNNWNQTVSDDDIVYLLGDVAMGSDLQANLRLINRLKGKKYLAYGNHDTEARLKAFKTNRFFEDIQMGYRLRYKKHMFILTHYPTITANGDDLRVINLYGHTHQKDNFFEDKSYMYHVGVDSHNCTPVSLETIIKEIKIKKGN